MRHHCIRARASVHWWGISDGCIAEMHEATGFNESQVNEWHLSVTLGTFCHICHVKYNICHILGNF